MRPYALIAALVALLAASGCTTVANIGAYQNGVPVDETTLAKVEIGKTTAEELQSWLGSPTARQPSGTNQLWYYDYTRIGQTGRINSGSTIFVIGADNVVLQHYRHFQRATSTGDPVVDAKIDHWRW